jgi:hypothetical protein
MQLYLFAVNHDRKGESILVFKHTLGSNTLHFIREFKHALIKTPNAVAATGPEYWPHSFLPTSLRLTIIQLLLHLERPLFIPKSLLWTFAAFRDPLWSFQMGIEHCALFWSHQCRTGL